MRHAGESELSQVFFLEVHLHFEVKVVARVALNQLGNDGVEVFHVHDVVSDMEDLAVLAGELFDLIERSLRRLAAIAHGGTIEPAEGAMLLGAPPASARGFERHYSFNALEQSVLAELIEMIVVGRDGKLVKLFQRTNDIFRNDGLAVAAIDDAIELDGRGSLAVSNPLHKLWKIEVAFAGANNIDKRKLAVQLNTHLAFAIATSEGDQDVRMLLFYPACECE